MCQTCDTEGAEFRVRPGQDSRIRLHLPSEDEQKRLARRVLHKGETLVECGCDPGGFPSEAAIVGVVV